jgi:hypothetical protein
MQHIMLAKGVRQHAMCGPVAASVVPVKPNMRPAKMAGTARIRLAIFGICSSLTRPNSPGGLAQCAERKVVSTKCRTDYVTLTQFSVATTVSCPASVDGLGQRLLMSCQ